MPRRMSVRPTASHTRTPEGTGRNLSAGCLAVGDDGAEEFFVMAHAIGLD